jgi:hypothetical protein
MRTPEKRLGRRRVVAGLLVVAFGAAAAFARTTLVSENQDTPVVELCPRLDIHDVVAFAGATLDRMSIVITK